MSNFEAFKQFAADAGVTVYPTFEGNGEIEPAKGGAEAVYCQVKNVGALLPHEGDTIFYGDRAQAQALLDGEQARNNSVTARINEASKRPQPQPQVIMPTMGPMLKKPIEFIRYSRDNIQPNNWLVKGYLEANSLALMYGPPANGKSFVALDLVASIATGRDWHGQRVKQGSVIYLAGEGFSGINKRLHAWESANNVDLSQYPLYISKRAAILTEGAEVQDVINSIQGIVDEIGGSPELFVVDTLARCFGGNENAAEDMGRFIAHLDAIKSHFQCSVLVVHHSGKDSDKGARGSTALKGAVDTEYACTLSETNDGKVVTVKNSKMKDADTPASKSFLLQPQKLNILDEDGQPLWSPALVETDYQVPPERQVRRLGQNQTKAIDMLKDMIEAARSKQNDEGLTEQLNQVRRDDFKQKVIHEQLTTSKNYNTFESNLEGRGVIDRQGAYIKLIELP